jgi:hypothetical protein
MNFYELYNDMILNKQLKKSYRHSTYSVGLPSGNLYYNGQQLSSGTPLSDTGIIWSSYSSLTTVYLFPSHTTCAGSTIPTTVSAKYGVTGLSGPIYGIFANGSSSTSTYTCQYSNLLSTSGTSLLSESEYQAGISCSVYGVFNVGWSGNTNKYIFSTQNVVGGTVLTQTDTFGSMGIQSTAYGVFALGNSTNNTNTYIFSTEAVASSTALTATKVNTGAGISFASYGVFSLGEYTAVTNTFTYSNYVVATGTSLYSIRNSGGCGISPISSSYGVFGLGSISGNVGTLNITKEYTESTQAVTSGASLYCGSYTMGGISGQTTLTTNPVNIMDIPVGIFYDYIGLSYDYNTSTVYGFSTSFVFYAKGGAISSPSVGIFFMVTTENIYGPSTITELQFNFSTFVQTHQTSSIQTNIVAGISNGSIGLIAGEIWNAPGTSLLYYAYTYDFSTNTTGTANTNLLPVVSNTSSAYTALSYSTYGIFVLGNGTATEMYTYSTAGLTSGTSLLASTNYPAGNMESSTYGVIALCGDTAITNTYTFSNHAVATGTALSVISRSSTSTSSTTNGILLVNYSTTYVSILENYNFSTGAITSGTALNYTGSSPGASGNGSISTDYAAPGSMGFSFVIH